jgi:hypothetical protein
MLVMVVKAFVKVVGWLMAVVVFEEEGYPGPVETVPTKSPLDVCV